MSGTKCYHCGGAGDNPDCAYCLRETSGVLISGPLLQGRPKRCCQCGGDGVVDNPDPEPPPSMTCYHCGGTGNAASSCTRCMNPPTEAEIMAAWEEQA